MWSSILALLSLIDDIQTVFGGVAASGSGSGSSPSGPLSAAQVMMVILLLAFGIFSPLQGFLNLLLMLARSPLFLQGFRLMAVRAVPGWLLPLAGRALRLPPMPEYVDALSSEERAQAWRAHLVEAIGPLDLSADEKITGQVPELGIEAASLLPSPQTKFSPLLPGLGGSVDPFVGGPSRGVTLGNDEYTPLMMAGHQASGAGGFGGGGPGSGSSWHQDAPAGAPFSPAELGLVLGEPLAGTALPPGAESPSISLPAEPGSRGVSAPEVEDPLLEALSWVVHVAPACFDRAGGLAELPAAEPGRPRPMGLMASSLRARYAQSTASPCLLFCFGRRPDEHPLPLASYTGQRLTAMVSGAAPDHPLILRVTLQQCLLRARSGDAPVEAPGLTFICSGPGRALPGVLSRRLSRYRLLYWDVAVADTLAGVGSRVAEVPVTVAPARAIAGVRRADPAVAHSGSLRTGLQHAHERLLRTWAAGQAASSPGLPSPAVLSRRLSTLSTTPMGTSPAPRAVSLSPVSRPLAAAWPAGMATPAASMSASVADRHSDSDISWSSDAYSSEEDSDGDHPAAYPAIDADSHGQDSQLALGPSSLAPPLAGWPAARSPALAFPPVPAGRPVFDLIFRRSHSFSDFTEQAIINESPWPGGAPAAGGRPRSRSIS
ncbi:hypothetical protein, variant [Fonticula alba]|nr:hypothetical protein, variant [Fonticula alba]KCV70458.1 hypothetical protein, variant [Fonticula alba]|eukprot:XP_009494974.1 hypothetical protein, variant [Fonticula alba]